MSESDDDRAATRTNKSSVVPGVMKRLNKDDPLIEMSSPVSKEAKNFAGSAPTPAQFCLPVSVDAVLLPKSLDWPGTGIHLSLQIFGGVCAKRIRITSKIAGANIKKLHECRLEFFAGQTGQVSNLTYQKIPSTSNGGPKPSTGMLVITWGTLGGYGTGLDVSVSSLDAESQRTLTYMKSQTREALAKTTKLTLIARDVDGLETELEKLTTSTGIAKTWSPYLDAAGVPKFELLQMSKRKDIKSESGGLFRIPSKNSFVTIEEAHVIFANGICLEYRVAPSHDLRTAWPFTRNQLDYLPIILKALRKLFLQSAAPHITRWWPVILNQAIEKLEVLKPLSVPGLDQSASEAEWKNVEEIFPWTDEQKKAIRNSQTMYGGVSIIEGAPGSGKTVTLAGIAVAYLASGFSVLLLASTHAAAKMAGQVLAGLLEAYDVQNPGQSLSEGLVRLCPGEGDFDRIKHDKNRGGRPLFRNARVIVSTTNAICSKEVTSYFGESSRKVMVMHDESHLLLEPELWATMFSLSASWKVKGLVMTCDAKEWPPSVATQAPVVKNCVKEGHNHWGLGGLLGVYLRAQREGTQLPAEDCQRTECIYEYHGGLNEFADQIGLPFVHRLLRQGFPSTMLQDQHRMPAALTKIPDKLVYKTRLSSRKSHVMPPDISRFHGVLRQWLGEEASGKDMSVIFLEASCGKEQCIKERKSTKSKRNPRNVTVTYDLLLQNDMVRAVPAKDIKIIVQFKDQQRLYAQYFAERTDIAPENLPTVLTLDTFRGAQSRVVIYDLVVTCGDDSHGLGIVANEFRANIAATRASETFIIVGSRELVDVFPSFWPWFCQRAGTPGEPLPYIVQYAKMLKDAGLSFRPKTAPCVASAFNVKLEWYKTEEGFLEWEWPVHHTSNYDKN